MGSNRKKLNGELYKCECGYTYVIGSKEDEAAHNIIHEEYLRGPIIEDLSILPSVRSLFGYRLIVCDKFIPHEVRCRLAETAFVAQMSMQDFPAGYDGTVSDADEKLFLLVDGNHSIGLILTSLDDYYWKLSWGDEGAIKLIDRKAHDLGIQKIARVWVAKEYRQRGIGSSLVKEVAKFLGYDVPDIGWELPLTEDGFALLRKLIPSEWWGRGDGFALQETLDKFAERQ